MKKPLPVKIVEALGWTYVALAVLGCAVGICLSGDPSLIIAAIFPLALTVGMVLLLRRGSRAWFLWPNTIVWGLVGIFMVGGALYYEQMIVVLLLAGLLLLAFMVAPIVLLHLRPANQWFGEMSGGKSGRYGCAAIFGTVIIAFFLVFVLPQMIQSFLISLQMSAFQRLHLHGRALFGLWAENNTARGAGVAWVDPATCTNSTQFVQALCEKYKGDLGERASDLGPYTNIWCIAINPTVDESFPLIFTCNIDPRELLCPQDENQPLTLTCPKAWGGTCFRFCEKAVVIVRAGGAAQMIVKDKYFSLNRIFPNGIPKPGPDTYFLTPTGRVDFVERQAADWLSIHEFASNDDSGDVSVKWRVAWPESLSGLNNEGLSSVRREILQMTFGPAWSDLNHGDKTWVPPPTIEEAEEEIKRKLEEPDIVWEFSGDVELDRPFGASLQDGAEWYARPVIVAKNDGNSSFWRECGCTYYTIARTFSIPDGREMTVDDYFDRGKMKELSALVWRRLLESVFPFDDETRKGMGHRDINLRDRNLIFMRVMSGGICFYFAPYSIFSGADGVTKAFLKWGELSKFRKK